MLKLSKLADYATVIMHSLAAMPAGVYSAASLADKTSIGLPTVSKLLQILKNANLVQGARGSEGGYCLARLPEMINLAEVIAAVEGSPRLTACSVDSRVGFKCEQAACCGVRSNWQLINQIVFEALRSVSLKDMTGSLAEHPIMQHGVRLSREGQ